MKRKKNHNERSINSYTRARLITISFTKRCISPAVSLHSNIVIILHWRTTLQCSVSTSAKTRPVRLYKKIAKRQRRDDNDDSGKWETASEYSLERLRSRESLSLSLSYSHFDLVRSLVASWSYHVRRRRRRQPKLLQLSRGKITRWIGFCKLRSIYVSTALWFIATEFSDDNVIFFISCHFSLFLSLFCCDWHASRSERKNGISRCFFFSIDRSSSKGFCRKCLHRDVGSYPTRSIFSSVWLSQNSKAKLYFVFRLARLCLQNIGV